MPPNPATSNDVNATPNTFSKVHTNSGSDDALVLAKRWLDACRETHTSCHEAGPNVPPTRLIDLQGHNSARVYLKEPCGEADEYAALSYCWGADYQDSGPTTKTSNIVSHRNDGIDIERLPKIILEAIQATRRLGLRYLSVDRLCIIQDSPEDWAHEAALMCAVYSGATLTLSADGSSSATEGLFQTDQALSKIVYKDYVDPDGYATLIVLTQRQPHDTVESRRLSSSQPIDTRGWTMQERLMSRRILHFTSDEMAWECDAVTECECRRDSGASSRELSPKGLQDMESIYEKWCVITQDYAKRSTRYDTDKLPALRGLVERFQRLMADLSGADSKQPDEYLAGLWRGDLVAQLAWKFPSKSDLEAFFKGTTDVARIREANAEGVPDRLDTIRERSNNRHWRETDRYVAPSWSWAHLRGPMSYLTCEPRAPFISYAEIIEAQTVPVRRTEPAGQVSSGFITLNGHMVHGLAVNTGEIEYVSGERKQFCLLWKKTNGYSCHLSFEPDDCAKLERRARSASGATLFLPGTRDHGRFEKGESRVTGIEIESLPISKHKVTTEDTLEAGIDSLDINSSVPEELLEAFRGNSGYPRYSFYLVLAESQEQKGKYERIGCFDVWVPEERDVMETLFCDSEKAQITII